MEIKVNGVTKPDQLKLLKNKITIINVYIKKGQNDEEYYITLGEAINIKNSFPELKFSAFFDEDFSIEEIINILETYDFDYFELGCPNFYQTNEYENFKNQINQIKKPKIINGIFICKDEYRFIKEEKYFMELLNCNVQYFQIELESIIDKGFTIDTRIQNKIKTIFEKIPVLYTDYFKLLDKKINNKVHESSKGIYFNLDYEITGIITFKTFEIYRILKDKI